MLKLWNEVPSTKQSIRLILLGELCDLGDLAVSVLAEYISK